MNIRPIKKLHLIFTLLLLCIGTINAQTKSPLVSKINVYPLSQTKILISWELPKKTKGLSITALEIYRDTKPFTLQTDISSLKPLATLPYNSLSYTDNVNDKREYFYAVVSLVKEGDYTRSEGELFYDEQFDTFDSSKGKRYNLILPGVNASCQGVKVKTKEISYTKKNTENKKNAKKNYSQEQLRQAPLPKLNLFKDEKKLNHIPKISKNAQDKTLSLIKNTKHLEEKKLEQYIFEEDLLSPSGGDEYILFDILKTYFVTKRYESSRLALNKFLLVNRKKDVQDRAIFYLGECNYYCADYKEAIRCFLKVQDAFEKESYKWIKNSLDLYSIPPIQ